MMERNKVLDEIKMTWAYHSSKDGVSPQLVGCVCVIEVLLARASLCWASEGARWVAVRVCGAGTAQSGFFLCVQIPEILVFCASDVVTVS